MASTYASLAQIRIKVRRLTKHLSASQITDADIDTYINTFILYDFPEQLNLDALRTTYTFFTKPYVADYATNTTVLTDPLYNFKNLYTDVLPDVRISGSPIAFYKNPQEFYIEYSKQIFVVDTGSTGDGTETAFSGTLGSYPVIPGQVSFTSIDANNVGVVVKDVPGATQLTGDLIVPDDPTSVGTINYVTGVYTFDFATAPANGAVVYSHTIVYETGVPSSVLFSGDTFTFRMVPDKAYRVEVGVYRRPTQLLAVGNMPELTQWWQFIAYGAAKKVLEDRSLMQTLEKIMPEFENQKEQVLTRSVRQMTSQRTKTIYS